MNIFIYGIIFRDMGDLKDIWEILNVIWKILNILLLTLQLLVEQNVHSVHCADFYLRTSKKLNKY